MTPTAPTVTFHGVRGSTPCDGAPYARYGGSTSSVVLERPGHAPILFDLGTGIQTYGDAVTARLAAAGADAAPYEANVCLTHLHWDHITGLPFFMPAFRPDARITIHGPRQPEGPLDQVFTGVMRPPYFPITPAQMAGDVRFVDVGDDRFTVDGATVLSRWVRHTDPALGFRVDADGHAVTYISDHGPGCVPEDPDDYVPPAVLELCDGVDLLIHDAQHTLAEYEAKRHFGHSSIEYAVHVAAEAGVRTLVLFHHCPTHSDGDLDRILEHARDLAARRDGPEVVASCQGMTLPLARA